jgi:hypothetical protein
LEVSPIALQAEPFDHGEVLLGTMQREGAPLGFAYDSVKSTGDTPVFSKPMGADWDLCWALDETRSFSNGPASGHCNLKLTLRSAAVKKSIERAKSGEFLVIPYDCLVPGFFSAYFAFSTFVELEWIVKAHFALYRLIAPTLENGVRTVLSKIGA